MSEIAFRSLEASDVEMRVAQCSEKGCSLLLYKDARCDMRLLDDAVGASNWQCEYEQIGNTLFCRVGIYDADTQEWIWKQDCGVPSNMEAQKGEASDAFKRACFKWGIGRELYTAPFIWIPADRCKIGKNKQGKPACYDRFSVTKLQVEDGVIDELEIRNEKTKRIVFSWTRGESPQSIQGSQKTAEGLRAHTLNRLRELQAQCTQQGVADDYVESVAQASFGKPVSELDQKELEYVGKSVKEMLDSVVNGQDDAGPAA